MLLLIGKIHLGSYSMRQKPKYLTLLLYNTPIDGGFYQDEREKKGCDNNKDSRSNCYKT